MMSPSEAAKAHSAPCRDYLVTCTTTYRVSATSAPAARIAVRGGHYDGALGFGVLGEMTNTTTEVNLEGSKDPNPPQLTFVWADPVVTYV